MYGRRRAYSRRRRQYHRRPPSIRRLPYTAFSAQSTAGGGTIPGVGIPDRLFTKVQAQYETINAGAGPVVITLRNSAYDPIYNAGGPSFSQYAAWNPLYRQSLCHKIHVKLMVQNRSPTAPLWVTTLPSTGVLAPTTDRAAVLALPYQKTHVLGIATSETAITSIDCGLMRWRSIAGMSKEDYAQFTDTDTGFWANQGNNPANEVYLNFLFLDTNGLDGAAVVQWQITYWIEWRNRT